MNTNTVTDGQLAQLAVKQHELFQRAKKGVYKSFDEMLGALQQVIEGKAPTIPTLAAVITGTFRLTVDYSQSLEEMIAAGRYDWTNDNITAKRFSIEGNGIVEYEARYFHFNRNISSESAIKEIEAADSKNPWSAARGRARALPREDFPGRAAQVPDHWSRLGREGRWQPRRAVSRRGRVAAAPRSPLVRR